VTGEQERAADVHRHHLVEHVLRVLGDRRGRAEDAGVGERDVETAEPLDRERDRGADLRGVGDVGHARDPRVAERGGHAIERSAIHVGHDDAGALGREQARRRGADAARPTRDHRDLVP
jgi:hypothetical protein